MFEFSISCSSGDHWCLPAFSPALKASSMALKGGSLDIRYWGLVREVCVKESYRFVDFAFRRSQPSGKIAIRVG